MKSCPSQREGAIHRDTLEMHRYNYKSKFNIPYHADTRGEEKTYTINIWLEHHMEHTLYYDVSLPPKVTTMILEDLECHSLSDVAKKV